MLSYGTKVGTFKIDKSMYFQKAQYIVNPYWYSNKVPVKLYLNHFTYISSFGHILQVAKIQAVIKSSCQILGT